jgi:hypothetical protein
VLPVYVVVLPSYRDGYFSNGIVSREF